MCGRFDQGGGRQHISAQQERAAQLLQVEGGGFSHRRTAMGARWSPIARPTPSKRKGRCTDPSDFCFRMPCAPTALILMQMRDAARIGWDSVTFHSTRTYTSANTSKFYLSEVEQNTA